MTTLFAQVALEAAQVFDALVWIDALLLLLIVVTAAAVVMVRSLFAATMLAGIYSLLMALEWVTMAAMDVAFTEAAVGAGISTVLLLGALAHTGSKEKPGRHLHWPALLAVTLTGAALVYGTVDMPDYGDRTGAPNPVNARVAPEYIDQTVAKVELLPHVKQEPAGENQFHGHVTNLVTAVLASYRSFDTMFEAAVIFTAGAGMILLLRRREEDPSEEGSP
ncbi:MAG: hydrogenase subunit MbhD domain-containing protein [Planctomycetota bacterium]